MKKNRASIQKMLLAKKILFLAETLATSGYSVKKISSNSRNIVEAAGEPYQKIMGMLKKRQNIRGLLRILSGFMARDVGIAEEDIYYIKSLTNSSDTLGTSIEEIGNWVEKHKNEFNKYRAYSKYIEWMARECDKDNTYQDRSMENHNISRNEWFEENLEKLPNILSGANLSTFTFTNAYETNKNNRLKEEESVHDRSLKDPVVVALPNGNTIRRLTKLQAIRDEGNVMRHCCGDESQKYDFFSEEEGFDPSSTKDGIYALRGPQGKRIATILIYNSNTLQQFGKANAELDDEIKKQIKEALSGEKIIIQFSKELRSGRMDNEKLKNYDLRGADLEEANLNMFDLINKEFQYADLRKASLQGAVLDGSNFLSADLRGADFKQASLRETKLQKANLQGSRWRAANLEEAGLQEANLQAANFFGARITDCNLQGANLQWTNLRNANIYNSNLQGCDLRNSYVTETYFSGINFKEANLEGLDFTESTLKNVEFQGANLKKTNFHGANLRNANFQGAIVDEMVLQKTNLTNSNLQGVNLQGINLREANLEKANLQGANLKGANLEGARLHGADLQGSNLEETRLYGVKCNSNTKWPKGFRPSADWFEDSVT